MPIGMLVRADMSLRSTPWRILNESLVAVATPAMKPTPGLGALRTQTTAPPPRLATTSLPNPLAHVLSNSEVT